MFFFHDVAYRILLKFNAFNPVNRDSLLQIVDPEEPSRLTLHWLSLWSQITINIAQSRAVSSECTLFATMVSIYDLYPCM